MKLLFSFIGFFAGICNGALGLGGGIVIIPALIYICKMNVKKAIGASLVTIVPTSAIAVLSHFYLDYSNIKLIFVFLMSIGGIVGAKIGSILVKTMRSNSILLLFGILLSLVSLRFLNILYFQEFVISLDISGYFILVLSGLFAGCLSSLFGVGGSIVTIPIMTLLFGLKMHEAVATSVSIMLPMTAFGVFFHFKEKNISLGEIKYLVILSMIGSFFGAYIANIINAEQLKNIFGIVLLLFSIKIIWNSISQYRLSKNYNRK